MALNNWMSGLPDNTKMCQIVLPATHDSGMSFATAGALNANPLRYLVSGVTGIAAGIDDLTSPRKHQFLHDNYTTQSTNVAGQLGFGARQFDLRMTKHAGTWRAYHGGGVQSVVGATRYGECWKDICPAIASFMKTSHASEVLILKMDKQDKGDTDLVDMLNKALLQANYFPELRRVTKKYIDQETIGNLRGRILICSKQKVLDKWKTRTNMHPALTFCVWDKQEKPHASPNNRVPPNDGLQAVGNGYPTYRLVGGADGTLGEAKRNVIEKQWTMKDYFLTERPRAVGMRGIWFNTFSWLRDIRTYSNEIWATSQTVRDALWLQGDARQNDASVDFLDQAKGDYIVGKNLHLQ